MRRTHQMEIITLEDLIRYGRHLIVDIGNRIHLRAIGRHRHALGGKKIILTLARALSTLKSLVVDII